MGPIRRFATLFSLLVAVGCGTATGPSVRSAFPSDVSEVLQHADKLEIYAVRGSMTLRGPIPEGSEVFHETQVIGKASVPSADTRQKIVSIIDAGLDPDGPFASCFEPRHAIHAEWGKKVVDLVICFECATVKVFVDGEQRSSISTRNRAALDPEFKALGVQPDPDRG